MAASVRHWKISLIYPGHGLGSSWGWREPPLHPTVPAEPPHLALSPPRCTGYPGADQNLMGDFHPHPLSWDGQPGVRGTHRSRPSVGQWGRLVPVPGRDALGYRRAWKSHCVERGWCRAQLCPGPEPSLCETPFPRGTGLWAGEVGLGRQRAPAVPFPLSQPASFPCVSCLNGLCMSLAAVRQTSSLNLKITHLSGLFPSIFWKTLQAGAGATSICQRSDDKFIIFSACIPLSPRISKQAAPKRCSPEPGVADLITKSSL